MIRNYSASADTTITNSFKPDLLNRGTGSNMGAADVLEVFSILDKVAVAQMSFLGFSFSFRLTLLLRTGLLVTYQPRDL